MFDLTRRAFLKFAGAVAALPAVAPFVAPASVQMLVDGFLTDANAVSLNLPSTTALSVGHGTGLNAAKIRDLLRPGLEQVFKAQYAKYPDVWADVFSANLNRTPTDTGP